MSLGIGQPADATLRGIANSRVEDTKLDGVDASSVVGTWTGRVELGDGNLDVHSTDFVGPCVLWEGRDGVEIAEVAGELGAGSWLRLWTATHGARETERIFRVWPSHTLRRGGGDDAT